MQVVKIFVKENIKIVIASSIIVLAVIILSIFMNSRNNMKIYKSEPFVYTKKTHQHDDTFSSELPYININSSEIGEINDSLINDYYEIIEFGEKMMKYNYYLNDNILSLIVEKYYLDAPDSAPDVIIYNVDIKEGIVLDDEQLLEKYDVSKYDVTEVISKKIKEYYDYEISNGYIDNSCDFDCYLSNTNSLPYDECDYYVKDNTLYAYKNLMLNSSFYYDSKLQFDFYNFKIK